MNAKYLIIISVVIFISGFAAGYFYRNSVIKNKEISGQIVKGKENVTLSKGKESIIVNEKEYKSTDKVRPSSTINNLIKIYEISDSTENYNMNLTLTVHKDTDSIDIVKNIKIKCAEKIITRVDTLLITRVDTLKSYIPSAAEEQGFFESRTFGFISGVAVTITIAAILQAVL